ncbi:uncharacterized protein RSE6_09886 [Rhynchosporium secalis]|uniref:Uncharacterized protein n=1 Tax=Rhynchosporium secalis TaxID=38038 RepID=A0A1E1MJ26_RHYSE|nr:uncharacterized protein RSE6_09886 [Rhynchosporium secalis]
MICSMSEPAKDEFNVNIRFTSTFGTRPVRFRPVDKTSISVFRNGCKREKWIHNLKIILIHSVSENIRVQVPMVGEVVTSGPIYKGHGGIRPLKLWRSRNSRAEKPVISPGWVLLTRITLVYHLTILTSTRSTDGQTCVSGILKY